MRKARVEVIVPLVFLLAAAFVLGFMADDVRASKGDPRKWVASLQLLPQRLESIGSQSADNGSQDSLLPLVDTYSAAIERLKSDYYYYGKEVNGHEINERQLTYSAIRGTLHGLGDPFTRFLDPDEYKKMREENEGNFTGIGARLDENKSGEIYIKEPMPNTPAIRAGIKSNDVILAVDDKLIKHMDINDVVDMIRGPEGTKVKLTLRRPGKPKPFDVVMVRKVVPFPIVQSRMLDDKAKIGYVRLFQFNEQSDSQFDEALTKLDKDRMKGLILDLRGNPGGLLNVARDIGSRFIESGPVVIIQERGGQRSPMDVEEEKHNHKRYPLVVLVDKSSASASEIVAGAIKDDGAGTLVGVTTFGKGRVQTIMPLRDESAVSITTAKYLTPKGIDIHKKGIDPDVVVESPDNYDPSDPKTDLQLTKAVDVLKVKMGLLPQSVLDKLRKTARAEK
jgi:carboxyl-terminal processing protease